MMGRLCHIVMFAVFSTISLTSAAEDKSGRFMSGGGAGAVDCPKFVQSMDIAKKSGIGTLDYVKEIHGYVMFITGFQTAYNLQTPDTCNIFDSISDHQMLAWTENYCRANPLEKFGDAVIKLAKEAYPRRKKSCR